MKIRTFTIGDLERALSDEQLWSTTNLPITRHRAIAHVRNPRARLSDVALLVAYDGDEVVAYKGMLPDRVFVDNGEHQIGWMSTWWVDPDRPDGGVGAMLLLKAFNLYGKKVAASDVSPSAEQVHRRFRQMRTLRRASGATFVMRVCSRYVLLKKRPKLSFLAPLLWIFDGVANGLISICQNPWRTRGNDGIRLEYLTELDDETEVFIESHRKNELTRRGRAELEWIYRYRWVLSTPFADETAQRYFFSSRAERFEYFFVKILDDDRGISGFLMLKLRDNQLTVPYAYYREDRLNTIVSVLARHALAFHVDLLTVFHPDIRARLTRNVLPYLARVPRSRLYVISKEFKQRDLDSLFLQDGDGDCVFF